MRHPATLPPMPTRNIPLRPGYRAILLSIYRCGDCLLWVRA